jgi:uncharacterized repeat protein (TIGR04076 family)
MANYKINCEVAKIDAAHTHCQKVGDSFVIGPRTPGGMCARAFAAVYPAALAMRFSEELAWQKGKDCLEVTCPDGFVVCRLRCVGREDIPPQREEERE